MRCRHCGEELSLPFLDLGSAPPSNSYLTVQSLSRPETWYPLKVMVCTKCWLVQTEDCAHHSKLFSADYAYFSSFSDSWLRHAQNYVDKMSSRFSLDKTSQVIEIASNDGYLLQYVKARGIPCLGVEPTSSTAQAAREKGIEVVEEFFGVSLARQLVDDGFAADLLVANNVLAHVPDINDFVSGFTLLLKPHGIATFEFPHLYRLVGQNQFDTVYHEHFSYLSLTAVNRIFMENGLTVFDVEEIPTHGGSLRVYAQRGDIGYHHATQAIKEMLNREDQSGMTTGIYYETFQAKADKVKNDFLGFLLDAKQQGKTVAGYGAAAKGNTLMNYAGVRPDLMSYVVDRNPSKQNKYMPGSRIPIMDESILQELKPDYIVILPWNIKTEVITQLEYVNVWDGRFVTAVPELSISS